MKINTNYGELEILRVYSAEKMDYKEADLEVGNVLMISKRDDFYSTCRVLYMIKAIFSDSYVLEELTSYMGVN